MPAPHVVTTPVDICNMAFTKLGVRPINTLSEINDRAIMANATYANIRDEVLRSYPWQWALKYFELSGYDPPDEVWNYSSQYDIPEKANVLKVHEVEGQTADDGDEWQLLGDTIVTNLNSNTSEAPQIRIVCIMRIETVGSYDASFIDALCARLMAEWADSVRRISSLSDAAVTRALQKQRNAWSNQGQERTPRRIRFESFIRAR